MWYFHMTLILPRIHISPMLVERFLHLFHLFDGSLLSIMLHPAVQGGINFQSFRIVGIGTIVAIEFLAPCFHPVCYRFAEIVGIAVIGILHTIVQLDFRLLEFFTFFGCQVMVT